MWFEQVFNLRSGPSQLWAWTVLVFYHPPYHPQTRRQGVVVVFWWGVKRCKDWCGHVPCQPPVWKGKRTVWWYWLHTAAAAKRRQSHLKYELPQQPSRPPPPSAQGATPPLSRQPTRRRHGQDGRRPQGRNRRHHRSCGPGVPAGADWLGSSSLGTNACAAGLQPGRHAARPRPATAAARQRTLAINKAPQALVWATQPHRPLFRTQVLKERNFPYSDLKMLASSRQAPCPGSLRPRGYRQLAA